MEIWVDVITNPLGLVGFSLWLLFSALSLRKHSIRWLTPVFVAAAIISLIGGFGLAYLKVIKSQPTPIPISTSSSEKISKSPVQRENNKTTQTTSGDSSPAISVVKGDVIININRGENKGK